jgi:leukotriene-A4 hydrolase
MSILDKLKFRLFRTMTPTAATLSPHRQYTDPNSASNFNDFQTKHLSLDWNVDFNRSVIQGKAKLSIKTINPSAPQIKLDGLGLDVKSVSSDGNPLKFVVTKDKFGEVLSISAPRSESFDLIIDYETGDQCSAVQWLKPEQTSGGKHPYLFTQCQVSSLSSFI